MGEMRIGCPQCGAGLVLDEEQAAVQKIRCPDCKAVFAVPREPAEPAMRPMCERRPPRRRRSASGSGMLVAWLAVAGVIVLVLLAGGVAAVIALRGKGGNPFAPGGGPFSASGLGLNSLATKANFEKLNEGMTLDEVQFILGAGNLAGESEMKIAFGDGWARDDPKGPPAQQWMDNGRQAGVTSWYQWRNGNFCIFVGFAKGKRTGKDKALLSFWVERLDSGTKPLAYVEGFRSDVGFLATGDPDRVTDAREAEDRRLNDPKWKKGNPRQLLLGRWQDAIHCGYEFAADGAVKSFGLYEYASTYRFIDDSHIEINVPAMPLMPSRMERLRVLVTQSELLLVREDGCRRVIVEYKRIK